MTTVRVADEGGDEMVLREHNGYLYPNFLHFCLPQLPSVKIRPDDILICAYPKSGTHWVWEMTRLILAGQIDEVNIDKMSTMIDFQPESAYVDWPSPRILNSHVLYRHLPTDVDKKKVKIIYLLRNPKDALVSFYNFEKKLQHTFYKGKWENYFRSASLGKLAYGSWFDYVVDWEMAKTKTNCPVLTIYYEDLIKEPVREVSRLCEFLQIERSVNFLKQVVDACSFGRMKNKKTDSITSGKAYRKGEVGDWKNWFTVAQNEWFDQLYQQKMKDCLLKFKFS